MVGNERESRRRRVLGGQEDSPLPSSVGRPDTEPVWVGRRPSTEPWFLDALPSRLIFKSMSVSWWVAMKSSAFSL